MATSAYSLNKLLAAIYRYPNKDERFTFAVAYTLGLERPEMELDVVRYLYRLVKQVKADIEALPADEEKKKIARRYIAPFNGLDNFSQVHMTVETARRNFLKPEHLVGLTHLDGDFSGLMQFQDISDEAKALSQSFHDIRQEVADSNIDPMLKAVLLRRLSQMIAALDHYYFFREDGLAEITQGLMGTIVLSSVKEQDLEAKGILRKAGTKLMQLISVVGGTNKFLSNANGVMQNGSALLETFKSMGE
ncbi:MAG: hypothetical protein IKE14_01525 [Loktanella sp.]|nr:hypothetical protein [Loktanella sp.]